MMEIKLKISGLHCTSCIALIKEELANIPNVLVTQIDLSSGEAKIKFEENFSKDKIIKAINKLGYDTEILSESSI